MFSNRRRTKCADLRSWSLSARGPILRTSEVGSAVSERTASGIPDDRSSLCCAFLTQNMSVGVWHLLCLAGLVLPCSAAQRQQIGHSAARGATSVASQKRPCSTASFAKTWLPSSSKRDRYPSGELPGFIRAEFERYLRCGLLCHGFARIRCPTCHDELLVAFSPAKIEGSVHRVASRRMADFAAHLRDRVLPAVAVRQWS